MSFESDAFKGHIQQRFAELQASVDQVKAKEADAKIVGNVQAKIQSMLKQFPAIAGADQLRDLDRQFTNFTEDIQRGSNITKEEIDEVRAAMQKLKDSLPATSKEWDARPLGERRADIAKFIAIEYADKGDFQAAEKEAGKISDPKAKSAALDDIYEKGFQAALKELGPKGEKKPNFQKAFEFAKKISKDALDITKRSIKDKCLELLVSIRADLYDDKEQAYVDCLSYLEEIENDETSQVAGKFFTEKLMSDADARKNMPQMLAALYNVHPDQRPYYFRKLAEEDLSSDAWGSLLDIVATQSPKEFEAFFDKAKAPLSELAVLACYDFAMGIPDKDKGKELLNKLHAKLNVDAAGNKPLLDLLEKEIKAWESDQKIKGPLARGNNAGYIVFDRDTPVPTRPGLLLELLNRVAKKEPLPTQEVMPFIARIKYDPSAEWMPPLQRIHQRAWDKKEYQLIREISFLFDDSIKHHVRLADVSTEWFRKLVNEMEGMDEHFFRLAYSPPEQEADVKSLDASAPSPARAEQRRIMDEKLPLDRKAKFLVRMKFEFPSPIVEAEIQKMIKAGGESAKQILTALFDAYKLRARYPEAMEVILAKDSPFSDDEKEIRAMNIVRKIGFGEEYGPGDDRGVVVGKDGRQLSQEQVYSFAMGLIDKHIKTLLFRYQALANLQHHFKDDILLDLERAIGASKAAIERGRILNILLSPNTIGNISKLMEEAGKSPTPERLEKLAEIIKKLRTARVAESIPNEKIYDALRLITQYEQLVKGQTTRPLLEHVEKLLNSDKPDKAQVMGMLSEAYMRAQMADDKVTLIQIKNLIGKARDKFVEKRRLLPDIPKEPFKGKFTFNEKQMDIVDALRELEKEIEGLQKGGG